MEVDKVGKILIDEPSLKRESVKATPQGKRCIFDSNIECPAPNCKYEICQRCPYGYLSSFTSAVQNVYRKIVGLAIFWLKQ